MKKAIALMAMALVCGTVSADSKTNVWGHDLEVDEFTGKARSHMTLNYTDYSSTYKKLSPYCNIDTKDFGFAFDTGQFIDWYNSPVTVLVKVDDGKPYEFNGSTYSNSSTNAYVRTGNVRQLAKDMIGSQIIRVRIANPERSVVVNMTFKPLGGGPGRTKSGFRFNTELKKVLADCGTKL